MKNNMDTINWLQVGIGFLSGGAFGALIKQFFDYRRNRIQSIEYSIELKPFYNSKKTKILDTQITISEGTNEYKFANLYTGTIEIINAGLIDFSNFSFGVTLTDGIKFIQNKSTLKDRHHIAELINEPTLANQTNSFDVNLTPFNRKDRYVFDVLLTCSNSNMPRDCINISSSMPVKLTKVSTTREAITFFKFMIMLLSGTIQLTIPTAQYNVQRKLT